MTLDEAKAILADGTAPVELRQQAYSTWYSQPQFQPENQPALSQSGPASYDVYPVQTALRSDVGIYNPGQYATEASAAEIAKQLGGTVELTTSTGAGGPPPQYVVNVGGVRMNAGLLIQRYATYPKEQADAMTAAELSTAGISWQSPATTSIYSPIPLQNVQPTAPAGSVAPSPGAGGTLPPGPRTVAGSTPTASAAASTLRSKVLAAANAGMNNPSVATPDQWGYYYEQVTGSPAPAPESGGYRRAADGSLPAIPFDEWWSRVVDQVKSTPGATPGPNVPASNLVKWIMAIIAMVLAGGRGGQKAFAK